MIKQSMCIVAMEHHFIEKAHGFFMMTLLIIIGVDNSSSSNTDNRKTHFLILDKGDTFGLNGNLGAPEKSLILTLVNQRPNFA